MKLIGCIKKSRGVVKRFGQRFLLAAGAVSAGTLALGTNAHAILPVEASDAVTAVSTFVTDIKAAVWPIAAAVTVGLIGIGLFKKFTSKAAG